MSETFEVPTDDSDLDARKMAWADKRGREIHEAWGIDLDTATTSARWASRWVDEYMRLCEEGGRVESEDAMRQRLEVTYTIALSMSLDVPRYPRGAPALLAVSVVHEVFCGAFSEEEQPKLRELLRPQPRR